MVVAAPTVLRIPPAELAVRVRERFGGELRRAGGFAQLCLLGAQQCLDAAAPGGRLGVLWSSSRGPVGAVRAVLAEAAGGEPVMPFSFVAIQPHLTATLLAQRGLPVTRAAFVYLSPGDWPLLLDAAQAWLAGCEAVLLGWVEEAVDGSDHRSDWCLVRSAGGASLPAARDALPPTFGEWLTSA